MSAISLVLLCAAAAATALGGAALHTARGLRRQLTALRAQLETAPTVAPANAIRGRATPQRPTGKPISGAARRGRGAAGRRLAEIRAAVADALADERERELAEARAFWAAQEARDAGPRRARCWPATARSTRWHRTTSADGLPEDLDALLEPTARGLFVPRQAAPTDGAHGHGHRDGCRPDDRAGDEHGADEELRAGIRRGPYRAGDDTAGRSPRGWRRRGAVHPSQPDYNLNGEPVTPGAARLRDPPPVTDHERTVRAADRARGGPYAAGRRTARPAGHAGRIRLRGRHDGLLSPGHRETAGSWRDGAAPGPAAGAAGRLGRRPAPTR